MDFTGPATETGQFVWADSCRSRAVSRTGGPALTSGASGETARVPFITAKSFASGGRALVWNLGGVGEDDVDLCEQLNVPAPCDWFNLPKPVIDALRKSVTTPLGFTIEAPPRVATFLFADHAVFMNYANASADVQVRGLALDPGSLQSDSPKTALSGNDIFLAPGSYALVKRRG